MVLFSVESNISEEESDEESREESEEDSSEESEEESEEKGIPINHCNSTMQGIKYIPINTKRASIIYS